MPENPRTIETSAPRDLPTFTVKIDGNALERSFQLLSVQIQKEVNRIPTAHLVFKDGDAAAGNFPLSNDARLVPGKKVEIMGGYHGQEKTVFRGIIIKHRIEGRKSGTSRLTLLCKDEFVRTTMVSRRRYFTGKKDSEVAEELVQSYSGLQIDAESTIVMHEELIQYDATDWDFIVMRAEANGQLCLVDDGSLKLAKPNFDQSVSIALQFGATVLDFEAEMDARNQCTAVKTMTWNYSEGKMAEAEADEPAVKEQGNFSAQDIADSLGAEILLQHGGRIEEGELQAWADATLLKRRMAKIRGRVQSYGNADVKPGTLIRLGGFSERFNGEAFVTGISHRFEEGSWLTDIQFGLNPQPFATEFNVGQPPASGLMPSLHGLVIGVVTGLEGDASGEERILVRLPIVNKDAAGARARIISLDAGNERGFYFRPEIGDEVVVGFLNNDPRDAIVLGALHGSQKKLPDPFVTKGANDLKGYVSRSKIKLLFDDEKKVLTIETPAGNQFKLDDGAKSITLQDQNGNQLVMNDQGIRIESAKDLILKASADVRLKGINVDQQASAQFKANGSAGLEVSSSATAVLKGSTVQIN